MSRSIRIVLALSFLGLGVSVALVAQGGLSALGLQEAQFGRDILSWAADGSMNYYPARKAFKAAGPETRAAFVKTAMSWARTYTESAAFKAAYDKRRAQQAPREPAKRSVDEELAKEKAERQKGIENMKKSLDQMPADMRPQMEKTIKEMEAQSAKFDSDPQMIAMMRQGKEAQIAGERKRYEEEVARHKERFPEDPGILVTSRLKDFLEVSKDVDFKAKLVPVEGRNRFENPVYEKKSSLWKLCYRAGPEAVGAARQFAEEWLKATAEPGKP